ncbi:MAG: HAD-IIA family hydrolase [Candidatus Micrarchaeota archaeon]
MIKAVIFDLDGTLYVGDSPVPGAAKKLAALRGQGLKVLFLTNAAIRSRPGIAKRLDGMGFEAHKEEVYSSAYVLARYIKENHPGKTVYVVGERGMYEELEELGIKVVEEGADIVAVGLDRELTYGKIAKALTNILGGAVLMATNPDPTYPTEEGPRPGAGAVVAAIENASGRKAHVIGKPNPYTLELIKSEHGLSNEEILIVGDRLDTDIKFARDCRVRSALVLSGSAKEEEIKEIKPDYVFRTVAELTLR